MSVGIVVRLKPPGAESEWHMGSDQVFTLALTLSCLSGTTSGDTTLRGDPSKLALGTATRV